MTRGFVGLALWMTFGLSSAGFSQTTKPRIALYWADYELLAAKLPSGARKAVEREVLSIFGEAGVEVLFQVGSPEDREPSEAHKIRVILMPRSGEGWNVRDGAMGAILESVPQEGTVYVFVPVVERTIGLAAESKEMIHDGRKAHALARALARVVAHETVHAIDSDIPHGPEGSVMSGNLTAALLLAPSLSFHDTTKKSLLDSLLRRATAPPP